jgi:hypothetical protein
VRKTCRLLLAAACAVASTGCIDRKLSGEDAVYTYQFWVPAAMGTGMVALMVVGARVLRSTYRYRKVVFALCVGGTILLFIMYPMTILGCVVIGPDRLDTNTGGWIDHEPHHVYFVDVVRADVEVEGPRGRPGQQASYFINFQTKSGQRERVFIGELTIKAFPEILERLRERNIPVNIPSGIDIK